MCVSSTPSTTLNASLSLSLSGSRLNRVESRAAVATATIATAVVVVVVAGISRASQCADLQSHALLQIRLGLSRSLFANLSISAASAASPRKLLLLLLEYAPEKRSGLIAAAKVIGFVIGAIDELNCDPEGTTVILAAAAASARLVSGAHWSSCGHDVDRGQAAEVS